MTAVEPACRTKLICFADVRDLARCDRGTPLQGRARRRPTHPRRPRLHLSPQ
jgi:hypothetical protein